MKKIICIIPFLITLIFLPAVHAVSFEWWNTSWHYRIPIEINSTDYERKDAVIETKINFTAELERFGLAESFDENSVRVVEYNSSGSIMFHLPLQFDKAKNYNASENAIGTVAWIMNGTTPKNQKRYYFIYFDTLENQKEQPEYVTNLTYSWDGEEFWLNNSLRAIKIDTLRGENTSGIYYATNYTADIFNASSNERTIEYIQLTNTTQNFTYDIRWNASFIGGPVKITVLQEGEEVLWNQPEEKTGKAKLTKKYIFYEKQPWIKIQIELTANASIIRESDEITAIALDAGRAFEIDALTGDMADPFSWQSAYSKNNKGLGIILTNETNTANFYAGGNLLEGRIGLKLNSTNLSQGESIFAEAYVYINDKASHEPVQDLRNRLMNPVNITKRSAQKREVVIKPKTDFSVYNRGETAVITANITNDTYNLVAYMNATLNGVTLRLYDDGTHGDEIAGDKVYTNNYTFPSDAKIGEGNLTVKSYDSNWQLLSYNSTTFNITNQYFANLTILNPKGAIERIVYANLILKNYRLDRGIGGGNLTCKFDSAFVTNITDRGNGNYSINFTAPSQIGSFNLTCNATKNENYGFASRLFYTEAKKTFLLIELKPENITAGNITKETFQVFELNATLNNTGNGTAYSTTITFDLPSGWSIEPENASCGDLDANSTCTEYFNLTIPYGVSPGNYSVFSIVNWTNPDFTLNSTKDFLNANVLSNPVLNVEEDFLEAEVEEGLTKNIGNFTINSTGNDALQNITFDCFSGEVCTNFTINFSPSNISNLKAGNITEISVFVTVPEGYSKGNYTGKINVSATNDGFDILELNISVPASRTWARNPSTCEKTVLINETGIICEVAINNTGNLPINFSIFPTSVNFTFINETNFTLEKQESKIIEIKYNTSSAEQQTYNATYIINATTPESQPSNQTIQATLNVVFGPSVVSLTQDLARQLDIIVIRANITDRSGATIDFVKVNITKPNNETEVLNLTNVTANLPKTSSIWEANYSTTLRGIYNILIFARDKKNGFGEGEDSFKVFARLNITLKTGRKAYYTGESGSIYCNLTDGLGKPLKANISLEIKNSLGNLILNHSFETTENGTIPLIPTFLIASDSPLGNYTLNSFASFYDDKVNMSLNKSTNYRFSVLEKYELIFGTADVWYPEEIMKFYLLLYTQNKIAPPDYLKLTVYDPADKVYLEANQTQFTLINQTQTSLLYKYQYAIPSNMQTGVYFATIEVAQKEGLKDGEASVNFRISRGGPYDLVIEEIEGEVLRGDKLNFKLLIQNMGEVSQDVSLDYWISKDDEIYASVYGEAIFVGAGSNRTLYRSLPIYSNQPSGKYFLNVKLTYSDTQPSIYTNKTFLVNSASSSPASSSSSIPSAPMVVSPVVAASQPIFKLDLIKIIPEELLVEKGDTRYILMEIKNSGNQDLHKISAKIDKIKDWFKTVGEIELLEPGATGHLIGKFDIPEDAERETYSINLSVFSEETKKERIYNITVVGSKKELLEIKINKIKEALRGLKSRAAELDAQGFDIENGVELLERSHELISIAERDVEEQKYLEATEMLEEARNLMEEANYRFCISKKIEVPKINVPKIPWIYLISLVFVLLTVVGTFLLFKKFGSFLKKEQKKEELPWEIIEMQYKEGKISKKTYDELRKKFRKII